MIDVTMWGKALNAMPKLSQNEWQALDPVAKWLIACRASVLFMTFTAAALGGLMAWRVDAFPILTVLSSGDRGLKPEIPESEPDRGRTGRLTHD